MTHDTHMSHDTHPTQSDYLSGPQIVPRRIKPDMTVAELIDQQFQAYNSARLHEAARLYAEEMLTPEKDVTIGLTMAGALTPAGLGGCVLTLMEYGFVDFIISTGANLYHDMHYALAMTLHRGDFRLDHGNFRKRASFVFTMSSSRTRCCSIPMLLCVNA